MRPRQISCALAVLAAAAALVLSGCNLVPKDFGPSNIKVPTFFPESPDAGPQATAPAALAVPPGNHLVVVLVGSGYQEYMCTLDTAGPVWSLTGPDATLYASDTKQVGMHSAGPTWTYEDGSVVRGKVIASSPSTAPNSIAQLLLQANSEDKEGMFKNVTYVQRLRTVGGLAPDYGCDAEHIGAKLGRQYSAFYLFYKPLGQV